LNWSELKACMRRKFVPPSYLKKKEEEEVIERIKKLENCLAQLDQELKVDKELEGRSRAF